MDYRQKLKEIREDRDMSQHEIAEILQTTRQQIDKYEKMQQEMTVPKFKALCGFYKVSANYILGLPNGLSKPR